MALIQDQMAGAQPAQPDPAADPTQGAADPTQGGAPADDSGADQDGGNDPAYDAAVQYAMTALYKQGGAKALAKALRAAQDPVQALADAAYQMMQIIDEKTDGNVADEDLVPLAVQVLSEVCDVAEAAGIQVDGQMAAEAMKAMLVRFIKEQGGDASQLEQAMGQIDTSMFNKIAGDGDQGGAPQQQQPGA